MRGYNKVAFLAVMAAAAVDQQYAFAFTPNTLVGQQRSSSLFMADVDTATTDVSVPYDAAARLAYDEWRGQYNKGDFDAARYEIFKSNYEAISVANVSAKKKAREEGSGDPTLLTLNEYGDYSEDEYNKAMKGEDPSAAAAASAAPTTTGDLLGKAAEAAEAQSGASSALQDAADALAEEEEKLAKQLGMDSVEEMEAAIDAMEGIAEDGGQIESDNLAREARLRSAYMEWCKEYGKKVDESRFPQFSSNYLAMEEYAKQSGKDFVLNEFADCTEEEYAKANDPAPPKEAPKAPKAEVKAPAPAPVVKKSPSKTQGKPPAPKAEKVDLEAEAIKAAKEAAERDAAREAARRKIEEEAAEIARQKAREWEEKQRMLNPPKPAPAPSPVAKTPVLDLGSIFKAPAPAPAPAPKPTPSNPLANILSTPKAAPSPAPKPILDIQSKPAAKKAAPTNPLADLFGGDKKKTPTQKKVAAPKPAPKPAAKKAPAPARPTLTLFAPKAAPTPTPNPAKLNLPPIPDLDTSDPVTEAFNSFFGNKPAKAPTPKKAPAPAPAPVKKENPAFSFFSPKPAPKPAPAPKAPAPAPKKNPTFSFFSPSPAPKAAPQPAPAPAAPKPQPFSLFSPKPAPKAAPQPAPAPAASKPQPFSLFSPKPAPKPAPAPVKAPAPAPKPFSFFGGGGSKGTQSLGKPDSPAAKKAIASANAKKSAPARPTLTLFSGGNKSGGAQSPAAKKDNIPVLSRWVQNPDGSITGFVSNSPNFRNNTRITTSPVRKGATKGSVVKTGSGSQYRLN